MKFKNLFAAHGATIFTFGLLISALGCLLASDVPLVRDRPFAHALVLHMASMLFVAFVATVFFSFREVQGALAQSLASLLLEGDISKHMAPAARKTLRKRLLLEDSGVLEVDAALFDHNDARLRLLAAQPIIRTHSLTIHYSDPLPGSVLRTSSDSRLITARHLPAHLRRFPIRVAYEQFDPQAAFAHVIDFSIKLNGKVVATKDDLRPFLHERCGSTPVSRLEYSHYFTLEDDNDFHMSVSARVRPDDPVESVLIRYPTQSFSASFYYSDQFCYDVAWFKDWNPLSEEPFPRGNDAELPDGIIASCSDWLFPGDGVVFNWLPRPLETESVLPADGEPVPDLRSVERTGP